MSERDPFGHFKSSHEIIRLAVRLYVPFPSSLRNVEDLLHESCPACQPGEETPVTIFPISRRSQA